MNEPVRTGNVYSSNILTSTAYVVTEVRAESVTIAGLRTENRYNVKIAVLLTKYELIGTPYTGTI